MKSYHLLLASSLALVGAQPAFAQNNFDGARIEAQVGLDRFYSEGNHSNHLGVGGEIGYDFPLGATATVGPYGTFWWAPNENVTRDGPGVAFRKSFQEWSGGLRVGVAVAPMTQVYGKLGLAVNEQRKRFEADNPLGSYYNHYKTRGWQAGLGVEQSLSPMTYFKAEARYSNYRTNSSRLAGLIGFGLRFGADEPVVAPPPPPAPPAPPPPPPPATQTCYDGSVILATDTCPTPPPPPPPPAPEPERG